MEYKQFAIFLLLPHRRRTTHACERDLLDTEKVVVNLPESLAGIDEEAFSCQITSYSCAAESGADHI